MPCSHLVHAVRHASSFLPLFSCSVIHTDIGTVAVKKYDVVEHNVKMSFLLQRLAIAREFGDKAAERRAYSNLGNAHIFLGEFEVAAEHYR